MNSVLILAQRAFFLLSQNVQDFY